MPVVYYSYYTPASDSISRISKQEHQLGRALLAAGLHDLFHYPLSAEDLHKTLCFYPNGKPYLPDMPKLCFNITHCSGLAACVFHTHPVGIDAELPGYFPEILIRRAFSENEKRFLQSKSTSSFQREEWFCRLWTLKEAYVKKSGTGVDTDLTAFSFSFAESEKEASVFCTDTSVSCYQTRLSHGQIMSVCYEDTGEKVTLFPCPLQPEKC